MTMLAKLRKCLAQFLREQRGNVIVTFGLAALPVVGFVGAAVDYSRLNNARTALQTAVDSAVLMVSQEAINLTPSQIADKTRQYVAALFNHPEAYDVRIDTAFQPDQGSGASVTVSGHAQLNSAFMQVMGHDTMAINVASTSKWGNTKLRVALALDVTGSMASSGKIQAMKTATKSLIDKLSTYASTTGDVYVSMVPFAKVVNLGTAYVNASWLSFADWDTQNQTCSGRGGSRICTPKPHSAWTGCVMDRDMNYDTMNTVPNSGNVSTLFPAVEYVENSQPYCNLSNSVVLQPLSPLTYDWSGLKQKVDALQPTGGTNQQIGLAWAWLSLMQSAPLNAPALQAGYTYKQAIILFSDGLNTENRFYGNGTAYESRVDDRQKILCDNIKAAGITIYAIQVNTTNDPQSSAMLYCASGADHFYYLTSSAQIAGAFDAIATSLSKLRIAR